MGAVLAFEHQLEVHSCGECGIEWAMPEEFVDQRRADGKSFWCPNGHCRVFREISVQKLQKKLAATENELEGERLRTRGARTERDAARRSRNAFKGKATLIRKRIGNGVCPCCKRSFTNVRRHMKSKHPGWDSAEVA